MNLYTGYFAMHSGIDPMGLLSFISNNKRLKKAYNNYKKTEHGRKKIERIEKLEKERDKTGIIRGKNKDEKRGPGTFSPEKSDDPRTPFYDEKRSTNEIIIDGNSSPNYPSAAGPQKSTLEEIINHELDHYEKYLDPDYDYHKNREEYEDGHKYENYHSKLERDAIRDTNKYRRNEEGKCRTKCRNAY